MPEDVKPNDEQKLFSIKTGGGYSALGYDHCFDESAAFAEAIERADLAPLRSEYGTVEQYRKHRDLQSLFMTHPRSKETWFGPNVPEALKRHLERARESGKRVIVTYGDRESGAAWGDRPERGTISRSAGPVRTPILVKTSRSMGGGAMLCSCIVRLQDAASKADIYRHPTFGPAQDNKAEREPAPTAAPGM